jgi:hypothetical protein
VDPLSRMRSHFSAFPIGGYVYGVGGWDGENGPGSSCEKYDPASDTWSLVGSISTPRDTVNVCPLGGCLYVVGGEENDESLELWRSTIPWPMFGPQFPRCARKGDVVLCFIQLQTASCSPWEDVEVVPQSGTTQSLTYGPPPHYLSFPSICAQAA